MNKNQLMMRMLKQLKNNIIKCISYAHGKNMSLKIQEPHAVSTDTRKRLFAIYMQQVNSFAR